MRSNNSYGSRASWARGFAALFAIMLAMGLVLMASAAEAAPFAYVTNTGDGTVSVIDTATNMVVGAPLAVGAFPGGVAVTPDGKHAYVANFNSNNVSVIDTATNTVEAATLAVANAFAVAVTPDGKHVYVTNLNPTNFVSVIDTATNTVGTITGVGGRPLASPSPRMGNTSMSQPLTPAPFR